MLIPERCTSSRNTTGQKVLFGRMMTDEVNILVTTQTYNEITLLKQKHSNKSSPSVSNPEIAVLAYFTADSTTLPLESELLVAGHQRQGCLLALAGLI